MHRTSEGSLAKLIAILSLSLTLGTSPACAEPVTATDAAAAVRGWLKADPKPLGESLGTTFQRVEGFKDNSGTTSYYVVHLAPSGFVIVGGDDRVEPVVAFAKAGRFDPSADNPLGALVSRDLPARVSQARQGGAVATGQGQLLAQAKWRQLQGGGGGGTSPLPLNLGSVSDMRVAPLTQTTWNQDTTPSGAACYNYYTPPYSAGNPTNYVSGCVATAMGQLMRYFQFPTTGIGAHTFTITSDGVSTNYTTRGGDGLGGPYVWTNMPLSPSSSSTTAQRQAIGALVADAGATVNMAYTAGESSSSMLDGGGALVSTFHFSSAIRGYNNNSELGSALPAMINPNLDAGRPALLGINGTPGGHAVVADGYGYNASTLYHHLNLGWGGSDSAWYALPTIDTSQGTFSIVNSCIYNVYTNGSGEIISGRVLDQLSRPVVGATVSAVRSGVTNVTTTGSQGIYALTGLRSASSYSITVSMTGFSSNSASFPTGTSADYAASSGNYWGADFVLSMLPTTVDHLSWNPIGATQSLNSPFPVTITAQNATNGLVSGFSGAAALTGYATGLGATNVILGNISSGWYIYNNSSDLTLGYAFTPATNLMVIAVRAYNGDKVSIWSDGGALLASQAVSSVPGSWTETTLSTPVTLMRGTTYRISYHLPAYGFGYYTTNWPSSFTDGTVGQNFLYAGGDAFPTQVQGTGQGPLVDLRYVVAYSNAVPVTPAVSGNFVNGVWNGSVTVAQAGTNVTLRADDGAGHVGWSNPFKVVDPVDHLSWDSIGGIQNLNLPFPVRLTARNSTNGIVSGYNGGTAALSGCSSGYGATNLVLGNLAWSSAWSSSSGLTLGYVVTPTTNLMITAVRSYNGDEVCIWSDGGSLLASQAVSGTEQTWTETRMGTPVILYAGSAYRVSYHVPSNAWGYYRMPCPSSFADGTIGQTLYYADGDAFPSLVHGVGQLALVDLRYVVTYSNAVPVSPSVSGAFVNGVWTGNVSVGLRANGVTLWADDGAGHTGWSNPFRVITPLQLLSAQFVGTSQFQSTITGESNLVFEIQASTNLVDWASLRTMTNSGSGSILFSDSPTSLSRRFYRARLLP